MSVRSDHHHLGPTTTRSKSLFHTPLSHIWSCRSNQHFAQSCGFSFTTPISFRFTLISLQRSAQTDFDNFCSFNMTNRQNSSTCHIGNLLFHAATHGEARLTTCEQARLAQQNTVPLFRPIFTHPKPGMQTSSKFFKLWIISYPFQPTDRRTAQWKTMTCKLITRHGIILNNQYQLHFKHFPIAARLSEPKPIVPRSLSCLPNNLPVTFIHLCSFIKHWLVMI